MQVGRSGLTSSVPGATSASGASRPPSTRSRTPARSRSSGVASSSTPGPAGPSRLGLVARLGPQVRGSRPSGPRPMLERMDGVAAAEGEPAASAIAHPRARQHVRRPPVAASRRRRGGAGAAARPEGGPTRRPTAGRGQGTDRRPQRAARHRGRPPDSRRGRGPRRAGRRRKVRRRCPQDDERGSPSAIGISGVPFFVIDRRYGVSGAQPAELLGSRRSNGPGRRHTQRWRWCRTPTPTPADPTAARSDRGLRHPSRTALPWRRPPGAKVAAS